MIDKGIKYTDVPQLVKPRKDGKRPGYRGDDAARSDAASGRDAGRASPGGGADDRSTAAQTAAHQQAVRSAQRENRIADVEELIDRPTFGFTDAAKYNLLSPKSIGSGIISLATGVPFLGSILTNMGPFDNREFYDEKVVPAGKTDLSYDDYMSARLAGEIDAYGNPIGNTIGGGGRDNQLIQQAAMINPLANPTVETPQGGVGALYAQYMRNLGYTL